jgi:hypothetical protein
VVSGRHVQTFRRSNVGFLAWVLKFKILCTVVLWALPLLFAPPSWFVRMGMPEPRPIVFIRLLGAAYIALVVGYANGLYRLHRGGDARNAVWLGIVSNGSAFLILLRYGMAGEWGEWGPWARAYMWGSAFVTASITAGLVVDRLLHNGR